MNTAKLFKNGSSQAVRLPKEFSFDGTEVYVKKIGHCVVLLPKDNPWDMLISSVHDFTADYLTNRVQPPLQKRDDL